MAAPQRSVSTGLSIAAGGESFLRNLLQFPVNLVGGLIGKDNLGESFTDAIGGIHGFGDVRDRQQAEIEATGEVQGGHTGADILKVLEQDLPAVSGPLFPAALAASYGLKGIDKNYLDTGNFPDEDVNTHAITTSGAFGGSVGGETRQAGGPQAEGSPQQQQQALSNALLAGHHDQHGKFKENRFAF